MLLKKIATIAITSALAFGTSIQVSYADLKRVVQSTEGASASFLHMSPDNCVESRLFVAGYDNTNRQIKPKVVSSTANMLLHVYDICKEQWVFRGTGFVLNLLKSGFTLRGGERLLGASLNTVFDVFDDIGKKTVRVTVHMNWKGVGSIEEFTVSDEPQVGEFAGSVTSTLTKGSSRAAKAIGEVLVDGKKEDLGKQVFADLAQSKTTTPPSP
jgi:hypothetical protein